MLERFAYVFTEIAEALAKITVSLDIELAKGDKMLDPERVKTLFSRPLDWADTFTRHLPLPAVQAHAERIATEIKYPMTLSRAKELLGGLGERVNDDLRNAWFYHVLPENVARFLEPLGNWGSAAAQFPSAIFDIEEAGKCLALERGTASVFHLMRALERGLRSLALDLSISLPDNPDWATVIEQIESRVTKKMPPTDPKAVNRKFYLAAVMQFRLFKDAVRNYVTHEATNYNLEQAEGHYRAVADFMRDLSERLQE